MNVFELFGKIAIDGSGAMSGIDQTVGHAKKAENNLTKTFKKIGSAVAAAFTVRAVVDFGKSCTQAYADIAAEESAFAQIMGDYADTAQAKLNAVADQTGITSTRMTGAMTSLTAKFKGLGYNVEDATTLATDGLLIAADAAAFWDMSLEESQSHLNSFINGSYEGGGAIGLFANDTQMAAYAIEQGIVKDAKAWAKLDEATKQATRLDYAKKMMADSGATGQAAKEAGAYANVMANLKESWRQFQGVVGKPILEKLVLPAMQKLNNFLPKLSESVQNGITWLETGFGKIKEYFAEVFTEDGIKWDALPDALSKTFKGMGNTAKRLLSSFGKTLQNGWSNISVIAGNLVSGIVSAVTGNEADAQEIGKVFSELFSVAGEVIVGVKDGVTGIFGWFKENGLGASIAIGMVAGALAKFALANPALLAIEALAVLVAAMTVDWANFESNYPDLVIMFEDITGLDFTNVANSLTTFQENLKGLVEWFGKTENQAALSSLLVLLGGLMMFTHPVVGTALIAAGGGIVGSAIEQAWAEATANAHDGASASVFGETGEYTNDPLAGMTWEEIQALGGTLPAGAEPEPEPSWLQKVKDGAWRGPMFDWFGWQLGDAGDDAKSWWEHAVLPLFGDDDEDNGSGGGGGSSRYGDFEGVGGSAGIPGLIGAVQALIASNQSMKGDVTSAIADGLSGITVTGTISTGNITLDTGALVGQLAPRLDLRLGSKFGRASM